MRTDKASVKLGNDTLLDFQLGQIPPGVPTIVVGEAVTTHPEVVFTREDPPGSGPVAAVSAGLALTRTSAVVLLAVDAPFALPHLLRLHLGPNDTALIPQDLMGKPQYLAGIYHITALQAALDKLGDSTNTSMRELITHLPEAKYFALTPENADCFMDLDTPEDLAAAQALLLLHPKVGP
jgi:molybdopterin-guanine dinucleotide biosynthesis protein A